MEHRMRALLAGLLVVAAVVAGTRSGAAAGGRSPDPTQPVAGVPARPERLPLVFEANRGQHHRDARFLARSRGFHAWFADGEVVLDSRAGDAGRDVVRMRVGGAAPRPQGGALLPGTSNYFLGNDATKWVTGVAHHADLTYTGAAPGVDVTWRSARDAALEYVVTAEPGADAERFEFTFDGAESLDVTRSGDLVVTTALGEFRHSRPVAWQETANGRRPVACRFDVRGSDRLGFRVGAHDPSLALVIDPTLSWSTYYGGSFQEGIMGLAVDAAGDVYLAGNTGSTNFPVVGGVQSTLAGGGDCIVAKINAAGTAIVYSTYLGGTGNDEFVAIAVDSSGRAVCGGTTRSTDFPTQSPIQSSNAGGVLGNDGLVVRLGATGSSISYATYLGGSADDVCTGIAVDSSGAAHVIGTTQSSNFPTVSAVQSSYGGYHDAFVTKIAASGTSLLYSTYLGGTWTEFGRAIVTDASGAAVVTGATGSSDFPVSGAFQSNHGAPGYADAFITKLSASGATLSWSSTLGGAATYEQAECIALDSAGAVYVAGSVHVPGAVTGSGFPATSGAYQTSIATTDGYRDCFVAKIAAGGTRVDWATHFGGRGHETARAIGVASDGAVWIGGDTSSSDLPLASPIQSSLLGYDGFIARLSASGASLRFSTFFGSSAGPGGSIESVLSLAVHANGTVHAAGRTAGAGLPLSGAVQASYGGDSWDGFALKLAPNVPPVPASLTGTPLSDRAARIDWSIDDMEGGNFELERAPAGGAFARIATPAVSDVSYADTSLAGETAYDYRLRATNVSGASDWTSTVRVTTGPNSPASLAATTQSNTRVALAWTDRSGAETGFQVERWVGTTGPWTRIATPGANAKSLLDAAAPPESALRYRIRAVNAHAPSEWSVEAAATTSPADPGPRTPANLPGGSGSIGWNDLSMAETGYELQRSPGSPGTQWTTIARLPANTTGYIDATVEPESVWSYRVRAFNDLGTSEWVILGSLTTGPYAPADVVAEALSPTRAAVSWTDRSKMEVGYEVLRSEDGIFVPVADLPANATGLTEGSLSQETEYTYRVRTFNQHGKSAWAEVTVKTPSALVVRTAKIVRGKGKKPKPSVLTVTGEFDVGGTGIDLASAATLVVGDATFDLSGLTLKKGVYRFTSDAMTLDLTPSKTGQSRVTFKLTLRGAPVDALDPDGETVFAYRNGPFDASGLVTLTADRFAIGRNRLVDPALVVSSFTATLRGKGRDSLKLTGYFDASAGVPQVAPDVLLHLDRFEFRAKGTEFKTSGSRQTFSIRASVGALTIARKVVLDWAKGTVQVSLAGADLGEFEVGAVPVNVSLEIGTAKCGDTYVAACNGKSLRY
jgi:hypothetical protein